MIAFDAIHDACNTSGKEPYWFGVERAATPEDWFRWVHHFSGKVWMSRVDLRHMIEFWFLNRGTSIHGQPLTRPKS